MLRSRPGRDITECFPELEALAAVLRARRVVLDGELVSFASDGKPDFPALRTRMAGRAGSPATFVVFDVLHLDGDSTRPLAYRDRRSMLAQLSDDHGPGWLVPAPLEGNAADVIRVIADAELEGVVVKRADSRYEPGRRTGAWVKHKLRRTETLVVTGWASATDHEPEAFFSCSSRR